ncbi:hypothetical protein MAR_024796 [Mya arenaria]|uniref:Mitochondria-eating protein C-terminal domain-containing protein n=1 Tax=Mya arenaria TaxID=6604 RepID=A0ABY7DWG0_MYAAR|nr:hypothetical protein MAR_024796 [Mya arenaria]
MGGNSSNTREKSAASDRQEKAVDELSTSPEKPSTEVAPLLVQEKSITSKGPKTQLSDYKLRELFLETGREKHSWTEPNAEGNRSMDRSSTKTILPPLDKCVEKQSNEKLKNVNKGKRQTDFEDDENTLKQTLQANEDLRKQLILKQDEVLALDFQIEEYKKELNRLAESNEYKKIGKLKKQIQALQEDNSQLKDRTLIAYLPETIASSLKPYKELRKKNFEHHLKNIIVMVFNNLNVKYPLSMNVPLRKYIHSTTTLCWLMSIQDPPVVLEKSCIKGDAFNELLFTKYKNSGKTYDYLVWPAVLLSEGGPVIRKGVACPEMLKSSSSFRSEHDGPLHSAPF